MASQAEPGPGVDSQGRPVVDPTQNVLDLVQAAIQRQDDLREMDSLHVRELMSLRAEYDEKLRQAETDRIDAIRAVDVGAVNRAAEVSATAASALAAQVIATADAFRVSLGAALEPIQKDIRDLRDAQSATRGGKEQVVETRDVRGEARLNMGAIVGVVGIAIAIISVLLVFKK